MNTHINVPYRIGSKCWIIRRVPYISHYDQLYIIKNDVLEKYQTKPVTAYKWDKESWYLKKCIIDEDGISYVFNSSKYLDENDITFYDGDIYIFTDEKSADAQLSDLINIEKE